MPEALRNIDKSCVFRETFLNAYSVQSNRYAKGVISGGVQIKEGIAKFDGNTGYIKYNKINLSTNSLSVRIKGKILKVSQTASILLEMYNNAANGVTFYIGEVTGKFYLRIVTINSNGTSVQNNIVPELEYIYGDNDDIIFVISPTAFTFYKNGKLLTSQSKIVDLIKFNRGPIYIMSRNGNQYFTKGDVELFEIYNRALTASEVKLLYQQKNQAPTQLPLLLDFDSTQGVVEDLTGRNMLTATSIDIKQLGKIKTARFNGTGSKIETSQNSISTRSVIISIWAKALRGSSDCYVGNGKFVFRHYQNNNSYLITSDGGSTNVVTNDNTIRKNILTHLLIHRKSDGYINFFINNVKTKTNVFSGTPNDVNVYPIVIGGASNLWYKGDINKVQIFDALNLQDSQIDLFASQLYSSQKGRFV